MNVLDRLFVSFLSPDMTPTERTAHIKAFALHTGFSLVGVAEAVPLEQEMTRFSEWLARGYHASLGYMERNQHKRLDVREILPEARSVIVVAQNYFHPDCSETATSNDANSHGLLSRYARGDDYHDVIPPKLEDIAKELRRIMPDAQTKVYTDTGAMLEKQWAVRAGLGWQGKHSNVISRSIGSWFFLGVILTTAKLVYDQPMPDYCGTCTACVQACPTQAIVEPFVVDAGKCISYWTIETKPDVAFPEVIKENLDGWLFGCDTCQDVCPWNRFQTPSDEGRFAPRFEEIALDLDVVEAMTQEEFSARFRKSPVKRAKMAGLKRNARALRKGTSEELHKETIHEDS
jgi:epoxyqueuosine reductase